MRVSIRKFEETDIENKIKWINDAENNRYLHYDLPLEYEKTLAWFNRTKLRDDRYDAVIEADGVPVGLIGLLSIDRKNMKAEYYVTLGEQQYKKKGVADKASRLLLDYAFDTLCLNKVYLYTERENIEAHRLFENVGFRREGFAKSDLFSRGSYVDRYVYGMTSRDRTPYEHELSENSARMFYSGAGQETTPIQHMFDDYKNSFYIKRDDLIPFSFGGNKARKAKLFFNEADNGKYNCVVTYGSGSSNHCRVVANMAAQRNLPCFIISPDEAAHDTFNSRLMRLLGADILTCSVDDVHKTIQSKLEELKAEGKTPFFIPGGGHGNTGTQAYVNCYREIHEQEQKLGLTFDYIFHASGTGTTQAGLVCGQLISGDERKVIGISIARKNPKGSQVVVDSVKSYLNALFVDRETLFSDSVIDENVFFVDSYVADGYGSHTKGTVESMKNIMLNYGIPLDSTYTGKAFSGMLDYIDKNEITKKNILFIHTGGTPLFFDDLGNKI